MIGTTNATLESKWQVLWTNPNPDAAFGAQDVLVNLHKNDMVMILVCYGSASHVIIQPYTVPVVGEGKIGIWMNMAIEHAGQMRSRIATIYLDRISFAAGQRGNGITNAVTDNTMVRPYVIMVKRGGFIGNYP